MTLPTPAYFAVNDLSARWGCTNADIAGWAASGNFDILTGIPPVHFNDEVIAGEVIIRPFDILPMFRRCGTGPQTAKVRRVRKKDMPVWALITTPRKGVKVSIADLLVAGKQVHRFEEKNNLLGRIRGGTGSVSPYDWEGMLQALTLYIHDEGVPASQGSLVSAMQDWFAEYGDADDIPDERSIRRRVSPVWRALKKARK
jgi:hypothetical protein